MVGYVKYRAIDRFEIEICCSTFHVIPGDEIYITLQKDYYAYHMGKGHFHLVCSREVFDQISQYLEKISDGDVSQQSVAKDDHAGMIQRYDGSWGWL